MYDANCRKFDDLRQFADAQDAPESESWIGLEAESRGIIQTLTGDQPLGYEPERVDEFRPDYDA
ncbi:MAG: hypothetical protein R6V06_04060, partial [Kiritimatiellia bacterium]